MALTFLPIPVPAGAGPGASVDVQTLGPFRSVTVDGDFTGFIILQGSMDDVNFTDIPLDGARYNSDGERKKSLNIACRFIRCRRTGFTDANIPVINIGAEASVQTFFDTVAVPVSDGIGAALDVSTGGDFITLIASGLSGNPSLDGILIIEGSGDGGVTFAPLEDFGKFQERSIESAVCAVNRVRVRRVQTPFNATQPVIGFGSMSGAGGGGGVVPAFAAPTASVDIGDAAVEGVAATIVRSDHQHAVPAPVAAPPNVAAASVIGVATTSARSDHTHGQQAGLVLDRAEFHGDELMLANNADWDTNNNAPTESDSNNNAWKVARYDSGAPNAGRGFRRKCVTGAITVKFEGIFRGNGVSPTDSLEIRLKYRQIDVIPAAAVPAWKNLTLALLTVPATAFHVGFEEIFTIGAGGGQIDLKVGRWHQFEIVRNAIGEADYVGEIDLGGFAIEQRS